MFYKPDGSGELSQAEMDAVRNGFTGLLAKRRFHPEFVSKHCDDLLATAHAEYVRYTSKGAQIEDPVAWMIHCAWRRLQNVLTASNCRPAELSSEVLTELVDEATPTPAQVAEDADRVRKVHRAIAKLDPPQRQVVALMYFEDMPLAEAARRLGWHESKVRRCHEAATKRLYKSLAVKSSDQLAPEIGLAAWLSFAGSSSTLHLPAGIEATIDKAGKEASGLWARANDLARRFALGGGGDATSAMTASGAGKTAGTCATVAVTCIVGATGIIGPGLGGDLDSLDGHKPSGPTTKASAPRANEQNAAVEDSSGDATRNLAEGTANPSKDEGDGNEGAAKTESQQVKEQTDGLARAVSESDAPISSSPGSMPTGSSQTSNSATPSARETQVQQQFNAFR